MNYYGEPNIEIEGYKFFTEDLKSTESFGRVENVRTNILNGGQLISNTGAYVPKEYSFSTHLFIETRTQYDNMIKELISKPCEVICQDMGDIFLAEVQIKKSFSNGYPNDLQLEFTIKEIPEEKNIININRVEIK